MSAAPAKRALVTGVSRGIGRAIAERLLGDGWRVHGTYLSGVAQARALADAFPALSVQRVDLAQDADLRALVESLSGERLDALVNNAGIFAMEAGAGFDAQTWRRTLEVNLIAPVQLCYLLERQLARGAIVNVASTDGLTGSYNSLAYAASKAALLNATKGLANVLARSAIRVNAVTPGWIATEMTSEIELAAQLTPLGRLGTPAEVAGAVAWLLEGDATFVTGASLVLDGGYANVDVVLRAEASNER